MVRRLRRGAPRVALRARPTRGRIHGAALAGHAAAAVGVLRLVRARGRPPPVRGWQQQSAAHRMVDRLTSSSQPSACCRQLETD